MNTRCPKCRNLGLDHDCADRLIHAQARVNNVIDGDYELEVTLTFAVPVTSSLTLDPHEMATHMRELWLSDEDTLNELLTVVIGEDLDLTVKPVFVS